MNDIPLMKYHLREWEVVGVGGKLNCHKCGSWLAVPHEAYPILEIGRAHV